MLPPSFRVPLSPSNKIDSPCSCVSALCWLIRGRRTLPEAWLRCGEGCRRTHRGCWRWPCPRATLPPARHFRWRPPDAVPATHTPFEHEEYKFAKGRWRNDGHRHDLFSQHLNAFDHNTQANATSHIPSNADSALARASKLLLLAIAGMTGASACMIETVLSSPVLALMIPRPCSKRCE